MSARHHAQARALIQTWRAAWFSDQLDPATTTLLDQAIDYFRRALELAPQSAEIHRELGAALHDRGELEKAIEHFRTAVALAPNDTVTRSNLAFLIGFLPSATARTVFEEARAYDQNHAARFSAEIAPHSNVRDRDRRLRIGYVSPNFCEGVQALYFLPVVAAHDHERFEIFAYSLSQAKDSITERIATHCDAFRPVHDQTNAKLAELIRNDQIDILVDLTMHMGNNRALLFARKPAPVQICWLAYPGTTGLTAMDYRITDPYLDPPGEEDPSSEKPLVLPDSFWCYQPLTDKPEVGTLPAATAGHVTFGCLNTFRKTNQKTLELWAPVLKVLEGSRLILLAPPGEARERVRKTLTDHGIDAERIDFVAHQTRADYLSTYNRIDICLDTWPVQGHTTSLDALWMGVPVISLVGPTALGRAATCFAQNLELADLVASAPDHFHRIAIELARDPSKMSELRRTLRARLVASPLMDAPRFTRNLEEAFRRAWRAWCEP
jgi:predicted O-linked N-acetylglucosamine transferase (SPINDLY family)